MSLLFQRLLFLLNQQIPKSHLRLFHPHLQKLHRISTNLPVTKTTEDDDIRYMTRAMELAGRAEQAGEVPVGAVVVLDGEIVGEGWNQPIGQNDPSAHAEIVAMRAAGQRIGNYRLSGATLYVTLEPCPMCAGAIAFARIRRLYFGAGDPKGGGVEHGARVFDQPTCHHRPEVYGGIGESAAAALLKDFFAARR